MWERHVSRSLSAYALGDLGGARARRVAGHVARCRRCADELDEVRRGAKLARRLQLTAAPDGIWDRVAARLPEPAAASPRYPGTVAWRMASAVAVAAALLVAALPIGGPPAAWRPAVPAAPTPSWPVTRLAGQPLVGSRPLAGSGRLAVGEWLATDASSRARVRVADIGEVDVAPNTRLRLVGTQQNEHRLGLEEGTLHARVSAPPRLFVVDTPTGRAVDLGCAYTLSVAPGGGTLLRVTKGYVALDGAGTEVVVPAGAACRTARPGDEPGLPWFEDASPVFVTALRSIGDGRDRRRALRVLLTSARAKDTLTLWHLMLRAPASERGPICDRLARLVPLPRGSRREQAARLEPATLALWRPYVELAWWR